MQQLRQAVATNRHVHDMLVPMLLMQLLLENAADATAADATAAAGPVKGV